MTELETALLNLLKANPDIILDVLKSNRVQVNGLDIVVDDDYTGSPLNYRKQSDVDSRFRLSQNLDSQGNNENLFVTFMFGEGNRPPVHSFGLINADNGKGEQRSLLEFNSRNKDGSTGNHIGVVFNTRDNHSLSITAEHGELVVRDEYNGTDPIAIIK